MGMFILFGFPFRRTGLVIMHGCPGSQVLKGSFGLGMAKLHHLGGYTAI